MKELLHGRVVALVHASDEGDSERVEVGCRSGKSGCRHAEKKMMKRRRIEWVMVEERKRGSNGGRSRIR